MSDEGATSGTIGFVMAVASVAALAVSSTAVLLQPRYRENLDRLRVTRLESMVASVPALESLLRESGADALEMRHVALATGCYAEPPATGETADTVVSKVYLVRRKEDLELLVLPVSGPGYAPGIQAFIALGSDLDTIAAFTVVEHAETPGLGARIAELSWQAGFEGKSVRNESGEVALTVVQRDAAGAYEVDGISGATRTGRGLTALLIRWLGPGGFGLYLDRLASGDTCR